MLRLKIATTLILALTLSSCREGVGFDHFEEIPQVGLSDLDALSFPLVHDSW